MTAPSFIPQPSIDHEGVETALVDWAKDMTGLEVAWAEEDGPQPDLPYVLLQWLTPPSNPGGDDYYRDTVNADDQLERELNGIRSAVLTLGVRTASTKPNSNAPYFLDLMLNSLNEDIVVDKYFTPVNMAVQNFNNISPGNFARDKVAMSRAGVDLILGFGVGIGQPSIVMGYIKAVSIQGTVTPPDYVQTQVVTDTDEEA